jgi:SPP1 family phage portal protein
LLQGIFAQFGPGAERPEDAIREGAAKNLSDTEFIAMETINWLHGEKRRLQLKGSAYYNGEHDFKSKGSYENDADGMPIKIRRGEKPKVIDNQYANIVDQKAAYVLGKPFSLRSQNDKYTKLLGFVFDKAFQRMLFNAAIRALNEGLAWVHPYYNENGELAFKCFSAHEICPFWRDDEHTVLDMAIRHYTAVAYEGRQAKTVQHIEVYDSRGIKRYILSGGRLIADKDAPENAYAVAKDGQGGDVPLVWGKIPLVAFKYNQHEIPLIQRVQSLQDAINNTRSIWTGSLNEDLHDTVFILKNFDGENIADFRYNLMRHGAVKVSGDGGVDTLRIERDSENCIAFLSNTKKALIENARGFDAKDDSVGKNPNEMNLRSMYADIDLDSDMMEMQFQAAFDQLLWFVDKYLIAAGEGDFTAEEVVLSFNRNMIVNDSETISNIKNSVGIISKETMLAYHPYVQNVQEELVRIEQEEKDGMEDMRQFKGGIADEA